MLLVLLLACETKSEAAFLEGDYLFDGYLEGNGTCGAEYAGDWFVTTNPVFVTITATEPGFRGASDTFPHSTLDCVGVDDFECTVADTTEETSELDVAVSVRADATGEWEGESSLDGTWTLAVSCLGADCDAYAADQGLEYPCAWTQPFRATKP